MQRASKAHLIEAATVCGRRGLSGPRRARRTIEARLRAQRGPKGHPTFGRNRSFVLHRWNPTAWPELYSRNTEGSHMDGIIYLVGLIVIVMFILSALGLR